MEVNEKILDQLEKVRETGRTNMLDKGTVQHVAYEMELWGLVTFIEEADFNRYTEALEQMGERAARK